MNRLRAYLVDDESLALTRLGKLLEATKRVDLIGSTTNPNTAVKFLSSAEVDVVFLDIHMPDLNGFELLERVPVQPMVIFTTAYDQYALKAFEVNSIDYLLKPIDPVRLDHALKKLASHLIVEEPAERSVSLQAALKKLANSMPVADQGFPNRICSRIGDRIVLIDLHRITHFYCEGRLTYAATEDRQYIVDYPISTLEENLSGRDFLRIHRSTLVNLAFVEELHRWFGGRMIARMRDRKRTELTVARTYSRLLRQRLGLSF